MLKVIIDNTAVYVRFEHRIIPHHQTNRLRNGQPVEQPSGYTTCYIYTKEDGTEKPLILVQSTARTRNDDVFDRHKGRKFSLTSALRRLYPEAKHVRALFWRAYWEKRQSQLGSYPMALKILLAERNRLAEELHRIEGHQGSFVPVTFATYGLRVPTLYK